MATDRHALARASRTEVRHFHKAGWFTRHSYRSRGLTWSIAAKFEPRDLWVGVYWDRYHSDPKTTLTGISTALYVYVCVIPTLVIRLQLFWMRFADEAGSS